MITAEFKNAIFAAVDSSYKKATLSARHDSNIERKVASRVESLVREFVKNPPLAVAKNTLRIAGHGDHAERTVSAAADASGNIVNGMDRQGRLTGCIIRSGDEWKVQILAK